MKRLILVLVALLAGASAAAAQTPAVNPQAAQLRIVVVDETGGGIPSATVHITPATGAAVEQTSDDRGVTTIANVPVGQARVQIEFPGFDPIDTTFTLRRGNNNQTVTLKVAGLSEEIIVADTGTTDTRGNSLTTTLDEDAISELSDDPDELQAQLEALTGGAGATFQVDGFRGGRLPSKDQIRQIRFRTNSFSADNHDAGRVQVEIVTRAGLNAWNGNVNTGLRTDVLNARNAFAKEETPEQFRRFNGGIRGPIVKNKTSLRINVDGNRSWDTATIFAQLPEGDFRDVVKRPVESTNVTVGLDHGLTRNSTLRFEFRDSQSENRNQGVGDTSLIERASTRTRDEQQVRTSLQTVIGTSLNAFRLQWNHAQNGSESASTARSIVVIDSFSAGGAGVSNQTNNRTWEAADDFDFNVKKHAMRVGFLLEGGDYQQQDARNQAGTYTFGSLDAYKAGLPTTFTRRLGQVLTDFSQYEAGIYWQDDFRINRNLSLSVGVREELQSHLKDPLNVMPRFGFTWNPFGWKTSLRGGYGLYYDWFDSNLYDQTQRVNGVDQSDILILNPSYPDPGVGGDVLTGGRVVADPDLKMPYVHQASIGAERALTPTLTVQASYSMQRGRNQLRSRDLNAPDELGVRPQPTVGQITQIESTGRSEVDRLTLGFNYRIPKYNAFVFTNYTLGSAKNSSDNPLSLPSSSLNPDLDWGPSSQDVRHRLNTLVNLTLPFSLRGNLNLSASSAAPFNITTGRDDNHDGVTNDRPEGVGRNSARGSMRMEVSTRLTRGFSFGSSPAQTRNQRQAGGPGGPGAGGPGDGAQGPPPGGAPGPGGLGPGGAQGNQRFNVEFYVQASNLLNRTNYQGYSGNQQSTRYLQPQSASQSRRVEVGMQFRF